MSLLLLTRRRTASGGQPATGAEHLVLEASAIVGKNDGDTVGSGEWPDASGNGFSVVSSGTPTYRVNQVNGQPVVRFNLDASGAWSVGGDLMRIAYGEALAQPFTILSVLKIVNSSNFAGFYDGDASGQVIVYHNAGSVRINAGAGGQIIDDLANLDGAFALWRLDLTASTDAFYVDGVEKLTGNFGTNTPAEMVLGGNTNGALFSGCDYAAQIVLANPAAGVVAAWESYLTTKYGLG